MKQLTTKTAKRRADIKKYRTELRKEAKSCSNCSDEYCQKHAVRDAYINISEYEIKSFKDELKEINKTSKSYPELRAKISNLIQEIESVEK